MKATYDADHHMLCISLPSNPGTPGCVKRTDATEDGVNYDIGHDDKVIGIEVMLSGPLEVMSGDNGLTRTAVMVPPAVIG